MCGRYALGIRAAFVRHQLREHDMPIDDDDDGGGGVEDDDTNNIRETYNFAPGYRGLVYRADVPDFGAGEGRSSGVLDGGVGSHALDGGDGGRGQVEEEREEGEEEEERAGREENEEEEEEAEAAEQSQGGEEAEEENERQETRQLDKRRRQSLDGTVDEVMGKGNDASRTGATRTTTTTTTAKTRYRLQAMRWGLVPFWTKRNPQYATMLKTINARDDSLASTGGMWTTMKRKKRCVVIAQGFYEWLKRNGGKEKVPHYVKRKDGLLMFFAGLWDCVQYEGSDEKIYTYTIITTDSNAQLKFLHDRMPVILDVGSAGMRTWLDPQRQEWTRELQALLRPFAGELDCYAVSGAVGKVGNNSPDFVVPVASAANRSNIANFFAATTTKTEPAERANAADMVDVPRSEDNAPMPAKALEDPDQASRGVKRERNDSPPAEGQLPTEKDLESPKKVVKPSVSHASKSPSKPSKGMRSSTTNGSKASPLKSAGGSQRITDFFGK